MKPVTFPSRAHRPAAIARACLAVLALQGALVATPALATNGYFPHGYGLKAKGMGGASLALSQDSLGGATNPAAMVWAGERVDLGIDAFSPKRDAERTGAGFATLNGQVESDKTLFWVPEAGFNRMLGANLSAGLTLYGNGGMNTTYPQGNFNCGGGAANMLCGSGTLGVDLSQLVVAPTVAYKITPTQSVGVALLLGYQRFKAEGLQAFDNAPGFPPFTGSPGSVTNNGYDSSTGVGIRLGWQGKFGAFTAGAAYAPKMNMSRFDKYKGLFAGQGDCVVMVSGDSTGQGVWCCRSSYSCSCIGQSTYAGAKRIQRLKASARSIINMHMLLSRFTSRISCGVRPGPPTSETSTAGIPASFLTACWMPNRPPSKSLAFC